MLWEKIGFNMIIGFCPTYPSPNLVTNGTPIGNGTNGTNVNIDPGVSNVKNGVTYEINSTPLVGTLSSGGGSGGGTTILII